MMTDRLTYQSHVYVQTHSAFCTSSVCNHLHPSCCPAINSRFSFLREIETESICCCFSPLYHTITTITTLKKQAFENIVEKGENAGNQHFLLFPQSFLPVPKRILSYIFFVVCKCFQFRPV